MTGCTNCGADLQSDASFCVTCGASRKPGEREVEAPASETGCAVCNSRRLSLLGVTLSSWPRCRSCGVHYCGSCRDRLKEKRARWWVPTLTGYEKVCPKCGGGVPRAGRWYYVFFFVPF